MIYEGYTPEDLKSLLKRSLLVTTKSGNKAEANLSSVALSSERNLSSKLLTENQHIPEDDSHDSSSEGSQSSSPSEAEWISDSSEEEIDRVESIRDLVSQLFELALALGQFSSYLQLVKPGRVG